MAHVIWRLAFLLCILHGVCEWSQAFAAEGAAEAQGTVIGIVEDFDEMPNGPLQKGFLDSWRWSEEVRARARDKSSLVVVEAPNDDGKFLRVRVDDEQILAGEGLALMRLAPFFPPEADAVRIRLQVVSGQAVIYVGGPTAYYGNSDVFTEPQTIRAADPPQWVDVVCNFNHPTWRNYRRAGFSTDAPRNYYNRWAQEPTGVFVAAGTQGEFLIDRIDVVALGEGRPFATFSADQIRQSKAIADFAVDRPAETFTLYMADGEAEWFEQSWKREKPLRFAPQQLSIVDGGASGKRSLLCTGQTAEEVHCTGVRTGGDADANAIAVSIAVDAPNQSNTLVGAGPTVPIDFLVFVASPSQPFPWQRFAPAAELREFPGPGFDYQFSYRLIRNYADVDFAVYQTRRYLKPSEWTQLVLPAADFTCVYGHGSYRRRLVEHEPLSCDDVVAVAWLNPWCRVGRRDAAVTTRIDKLSFVEVPGSPAELCSFWQVPDVKKLKFHDSDSPRGRIQHIGLPEDHSPPQ